MTKPEKLDRWIVMSIVLHAGLVAVALFSPGFFSLQGSETWGGAGAGDAINVKIESGNSAGIALPSPEVVKENAAANDSKGLYQSEPETPPPPPPEKAEPIPEKIAPPKIAKTAKAEPPAPPKIDHVAKKPTPDPATPSNAVPYGGGGQPALAYGQSGSQAGPASIIGDGAFGTKYAAYVQAMTRKISQNWLKGLVEPTVASGPKVHVSFDIDRDGNISNVSIVQSSNITTLDNSAKRALYASNPLQRLPSDYIGSKVSVSFYFEYIK